MAGRKNYHVVFSSERNERGQLAWGVKLENSRGVIPNGWHRKKTTAVRHAKREAKKKRNRPSEVLVHKRGDGRIHERATFDNDPHPPKG